MKVSHTRWKVVEGLSSLGTISHGQVLGGGQRSRASGLGRHNSHSREGPMAIIPGQDGHARANKLRVLGHNDVVVVMVVQIVGGHADFLALFIDRHQVKFVPNNVDLRAARRRPMACH